MKKLLFLAGLFFAVATASAQAPLEQGGTQLNVGVGLSSWATPIFIGLDYGVGHDFTVGGELSYQSKTDENQFAEFKYTSIGIFVNGNYHFNRILNIPSKVDLYAGLNLGYYIGSSKITYKFDNEYLRRTVSDDSGLSGLGLAAQIGARYFFTDNFGLNLELGGGTTSGGKLGITYKF